MKYHVEDSLSNFKFWSGGKERADLLSSEQLDAVEEILEETAPGEGWSDTAINDMFWFDFDTICGWLGYKDEEHLEKDVSDDFLEEVECWGEKTSIDYDSLFAVAGLSAEDYRYTNDDGEEEYDWDRATDDFDEWWNGLDDFAKVEVYRIWKQ